MNIAILGAGMVGRTMALDLAKTHHVTSFDVSEENLELLKLKNESIFVRKENLLQYNNYKTWLEPFDIIVSAVPGFMGFKTLETIITCGKNVADISFFSEDALELDALAKKNNVTAITDVGVAPGVSNFILGRYNEEMKVDSFECYVGGLPKNRVKPFEYKAPFSPIDVIEEYIRPARYQVNGSVVIKPALSEAELIDFNKVGILEAFNTDGLRSLLYTMAHIPNLKEKTLRYPGHIDLIIALQQAGFFEKEPINYNGMMVSPLEFSSNILINNWKLGEDEEELTVMKVIVEGVINKTNHRVEYNLLDVFDNKTKTSSMSRTTGYTCTAAVELIAQKMFSEKGVFPPELIGKHKICFDFVIQYLKERNVIWNKKVEIK